MADKVHTIIKEKKLEIKTLYSFQQYMVMLNVDGLMVK